jgi:hypothetical protein
MMRLSKSMVADARKWLRYFCTPAELGGRVDELRKTLGCEAFFNQAGLDFIRDAWAAAKFSMLRSATSTRLFPDTRPDFELKFDFRTEIYERVEVDGNGRARGDEYSKLAVEGFPIRNLPVEEWPTAPDIAKSTRAMAIKKAERAKRLAALGTPYPINTRLLFHINLWNFVFEADEMQAIFVPSVEPARPYFESLWILWNELAFEV